MQRKISNERLAFLTRDVSTRNIDLSHVRDINRIMRSRNNNAADYRAYALCEKISASFVAMNS